MYRENRIAITAGDRNRALLLRAGWFALAVFLYAARRGLGKPGSGELLWFRARGGRLRVSRFRHSRSYGGRRAKAAGRLRGGGARPITVAHGTTEDIERERNARASVAEQAARLPDQPGSVYLSANAKGKVCLRRQGGQVRCETRGVASHFPKRRGVGGD